jgi:hypothetical protein
MSSRLFYATGGKAACPFCGKVSEYDVDAIFYEELEEWTPTPLVVPMCRHLEEGGEWELTEKSWRRWQEAEKKWQRKVLAPQEEQELKDLSKSLEWEVLVYDPDAEDE